MYDLMDKYKRMIFIRLFEQKILELFSQNLLSGTTHTCIGQEAVAVAAMSYIGKEDIVFSNHRCHGHYLAYGGPAELLLAEIMSKEKGLCEGRGGSQHIHYKNFYTNGIQGGIVPNAAGMAWAEKINNTGNIAVVFMGDGTLGQGVVYETLNMAALYEIPILFIVENNQYAMTTKVNDAVAGNIKERISSFAIECNEVEAKDIEVLEQQFAKAYQYVRTEKKPFCQMVKTYRLGAHSKGDDTRDKDEVSKHWQEDSIVKLEQQLDPYECNKIKAEISDYLEELVAKTIEIPIKMLTDNVLKNQNIREFNCYNSKDIKCVTAINFVIDELMHKNEDVLLLGEDIRDEYGGAFKVTKGLSTKYNDRVINTPISEAGFIGMAVGLALNKKRPIVELMFGDFISLGFDQLLNHAAKYAWIYGEEIEVPIILRLPMGGGRGYGPTHSQSLEKFLVGIPLITVVALSPIHDIAELYQKAFENIKSPLLIIENKKMYSEKLLKCTGDRYDKFYLSSVCNHMFPSVKMTLDRDNIADIVLISYGEMTRELIDISVEFMIQREIQIDLIIVAQLSPIPVSDLCELVSDTNIIGVIEEGTECAGWGAEVIATLTEKMNYKRFFRVAANDLPIPNGIELEEQMSCNRRKIIQKIERLLV